jgi:hypothetical protein
MERRAMRALLLMVVLLGAVLSTPVAANGSTETYTITGHVLLENGQAAGSSTVRLDDRGSVMTDQGTYVIENVEPGRHTIRAYFMGDGHVAIYREIMVTGDASVDFTIGQNVVTASVADAQGDPMVADLRTLDGPWTSAEGWTEFGPFPTGTLVEVQASFEDGSTATHAVRSDGGKIGEPSRNHVPVTHGATGVYGFVQDQLGNPVANIDVTTGSRTATTMGDGMYTMHGLDVNVNHTFSYTQQGLEVAGNQSLVLDGTSGWKNLTLERALVLPGNVSFTTGANVVSMQPFLIEWTTAPNANRYVLTLDGIPMYDGPSTAFTFTPQTEGEHRFELKAHNPNGSTAAFQDLLMVVLPEQGDNGHWTAGMQWTYDQTYTPAASDGVLRRTYTCLGMETVEDAFGVERSTYLLDVHDPTYLPDERSMRWVDADSLLGVRSYWSDDPSSSNQFTDASMGWSFTDAQGDASTLMNGSTSVWFNRTTVIGVPGHPNGYDDTNNTVSVQESVNVTTPAGSFIATKYTLTDDDDGVVSWELYYNATVRNFVKVVDRLPGSHSDMVEKVLVAFDVPTAPVFITEANPVSTRTFTLEWGAFPGAERYVVVHDGAELYNGTETNLTTPEFEDGSYTFTLEAIMTDGRRLASEDLTLDVAYVSPRPTFDTGPSTAESNDEIALSWSHDAGVSFVLLHERPDGSTEEVEGLDRQTYTAVVDDAGRHRFRIKAIEADGTTSDWSESVVVMVEVPNESTGQSNNPWVIVAGVLVLVTIGIQLFRGRPS